MLISVFSLTSFAEKPPRLVDGAYLLTDAEAERVTALLDRISVDNDFDVVIVTVSDTGFEDIVDFADDYYDYNYYGEDGLMLLVDMGGRDWWITTDGKGISAFTDKGIQNVGDAVAEYLSDDEYYNAFDLFADLAEEYIDVYETTGRPMENQKNYFTYQRCRNVCNASHSLRKQRYS